MLVLGVVASVSFSQFLSLLFSDPNIAVGVFMIVMAEYSFLVFKNYFVSGYFLPNMFFCFAISQQISNSANSRNIHYDASHSESLQALVLILQTFVYFSLAVFVDKVKRRRRLCFCRSLGSASLRRSKPISADFIHSKRKISIKFEVERGSVTAILGPTESGNPNSLIFLQELKQ